MTGNRELDALTAHQDVLTRRVMLAKLDAASIALTGRTYTSSAKPAPPSNRDQRRADKRVRARQRRKKRKG